MSRLKAPSRPVTASLIMSSRLSASEWTMRCSTSSLSLVDWKMLPRRSISFLSWKALVMFPLWAMARRPTLVLTTMGCALSRLTRPVVE